MVRGGWYGESRRHADAARGIKTGSKKRVRRSLKRHEFYTCTSSGARAAAYRKGQVVVPGEVVSDPGDMGAGLYGDTWKSRTKFHGKRCFRVTIDRSMLLHLENPYSPESVPKWLRDVLFTESKDGWVMRTVQLPWEERIQAAKEVRDAVLAKGYCGVYTGSAKFDGIEHIEYAIFSNDCVLSVEGGNSRLGCLPDTAMSHPELGPT